MLRSAFAHIFHGARGVSRPKVHEKRDSDEGDRQGVARGTGRETNAGSGGNSGERKRKKKIKRNILL